MLYLGTITKVIKRRQRFRYHCLVWPAVVQELARRRQNWPEEDRMDEFLSVTTCHKQIAGVLTLILAYQSICVVLVVTTSSSSGCASGIVQGNRAEGAFCWVLNWKKLSKDLVAHVGSPGKNSSLVEPYQVMVFHCQKSAKNT